MKIKNMLVLVILGMVLVSFGTGCSSVVRRNDVYTSNSPSGFIHTDRSTEIRREARWPFDGLLHVTIVDGGYQGGYRGGCNTGYDPVYGSHLFSDGYSGNCGYPPVTRPYTVPRCQVPVTRYPPRQQYRQW